MAKTTNFHVIGFSISSDFDQIPYIDVSLQLRYRVNAIESVASSPKTIQNYNATSIFFDTAKPKNCQN